MPSFKTILFPADFSEHTREAFPIACALARGSATRVIVLHVAEPALFEKDPSETGAGFPVFLPTDTKSHRAALEQQLREFYPPDQAPGVEHVVRHGAGATAHEVLDEARKAGADLIVMGTRGRTGLGRLVMGSVAEGVMRGATCPVIAVKIPISDEPLAEPAQG